MSRIPRKQAQGPRRGVHLSGVIAFACAMALGVSVVAFKPTSEQGHVGIVRDALSTITRTLTTGEVIRFSTRAIDQVRDATAGVDEIFSSRGEFSVPTAHCDDELLPECTQRLITVKAAVVSLSQARNGEEARAQLGRALHTLQDFYSHSNWVNSPGPANGSFNPTLGTGTIPRLALSAATCVDDFFDRVLTGAGLISITTGYFGGVEPPANKCAHGVLPGAGIHKDDRGRPFFAQARARAVEGTRDFINQILTTLGSNDAAVRALMDARGTLGFVIDDTGSMGGVIDGVKAVVAEIVDAAAADPDAQPDDYLLETFNDPSIGSPFVTTDATALLGAVNAISVSGGGDCPELSQGGLLAAIAAARGGSRLYLFSDASAQDSGLAGNVVAAANAKEITLNYVLNGSCSPVDPAYIRGAQETGGQLFFVSAGEIANLFGLIKPTLTGDLQPLLILNATLSPGTRSYTVPVDPSITSVTFSVALDFPTAIRVFRPGGIEVRPTDIDANVTALSTGRIVTVSDPASGDWRLELTGSGDLSASIMGNSPFQLGPAGFVERRGREGHEGLFPINGQPVLGDAQLARAKLRGSVGTVSFEAVSPAGVRIGDLPLLAGDPDAASDEFVGSGTLPTEKFRVYARGVDAAGFEFVRAYPVLFGVQSVRVRPVAAGVQLALGRPTPVEFDVTNLGPAGTFVITAADDAGFITGVSPANLTIAAGGTSRVTIDMLAPATTTVPFDTLTVVARSSVDPSVSNSARIGLAVGVADQDGDGVPDDRDQCMTSNVSPTIIIDGRDSGVGNALLADGCYMLDFIERAAGEARNHGGFVSDVAHLTNSWMRAGLLTDGSKGAIQRTAARARIP